jgi:hypothetical protein
MKRPSLTPSMAVSLAALTVALGGTGYAAVKLPRNSVGNPQIKRSAVTGDKVQDGSLFANDFAAGQIPRGRRATPARRARRYPPAYRRSSCAAIRTSCE